MKGIIFSAHSLPLVLNRTKRMTRRVINPQPISVWGQGVHQSDGTYRVHCRCPKGTKYPRGSVDFLEGPMGDSYIKPKYKVGEVCFAKENFEVVGGWWQKYRATIKYSDGTVIKDVDTKGSTDWITWFRENRKLSSLFMPEWASRAKVKIMSVKVERLSDISDEDCLKEGIKLVRHPSVDLYESPTTDELFATPKLAYEHYYNTVNPKGPRFADGLWVWVYELEVLG